LTFLQLAAYQILYWLLQSFTRFKTNLDNYSFRISELMMWRFAPYR